MAKHEMGGSKAHRRKEGAIAYQAALHSLANRSASTTEGVSSATKENDSSTRLLSTSRSAFELAKEALQSVEAEEKCEQFQHEREHGNVEYKWKLVGKTPERLQHLVTQLNFRLNEGAGEAVYEVGVHDDGAPVGLTEDELVESVVTLKKMADQLHCQVIIQRVATGSQGKMAELLVKKLPSVNASISRPVFTPILTARSANSVHSEPASSYNQACLLNPIASHVSCATCDELSPQTPDQDSPSPSPMPLSPALSSSASPIPVDMPSSPHVLTMTFNSFEKHESEISMDVSSPSPTLLVEQKSSRNGRRKGKARATEGADSSPVKPRDERVTIKRRSLCPPADIFSDEGSDPFGFGSELNDSDDDFGDLLQADRSPVSESGTINSFPCRVSTTNSFPVASPSASPSRVSCGSSFTYYQRSIHPRLATQPSPPIPSSKPASASSSSRGSSSSSPHLLARTSNMCMHAGDVDPAVNYHKPVILE